MSEYIRLARSLYGASGPSLRDPDTRAKLFMRPVVASGPLLVKNPDFAH
jgi:hypothetical protein